MSRLSHDAGSAPGAGSALLRQVASLQAGPDHITNDFVFTRLVN